MRYARIKDPVVGTFYSSLYNYPAPVNLTYFWNFGIYALLVLGVQIVTGLILAMHYISDEGLAFSSVEHIMRDVNYGWLFRYIHANGASMFFIVVYIHIFRGLYYGSFVRPRAMLWVVGVVIFFIMIVTAFMGYVLPWGQMSFWGATVITNLFSAIPYIGGRIVIWLWGGYSVGGPTLSRFFAFHFFFPFVLLFLVVLHIVYLHKDGSNNFFGVDFFDYDRLMFYPYYILKDLFGVISFLFLFAVFIFSYPNVLGHPDNYSIANPLVTPPHIVPEWYFLPFYAILRSIPDKLFGVVALGFAILSLFFVPMLLHTPVRSFSFKPISQVFFWVFVFSSVLLGWVGSLPVKFPFVFLGQFLTCYYFIYFFPCGPFALGIDHWLIIQKVLDFLN
jgi:ubiquinol-cytochrome c reductase cytochrome b subunit